MMFQQRLEEYIGSMQKKIINNVNQRILIINEQTEQVVGFTTDTSLVVSDVTASYLVRPVNEYGSLGLGSSTQPTLHIEQAFTSKAIISTTYYSPHGICSATPHKGFNIVVRQLSDGTQQVSKLMEY